MNDQEAIFESYRSLNEDLGLGPKQKGNETMDAPSIGSSNGNVGVSNMDIAKSSLTPSAEDEEITGNIEADIENLKKMLDFLKRYDNEQHNKLIKHLYKVAKCLDAAYDELESYYDDEKSVGNTDDD